MINHIGEFSKLIKEQLEKTTLQDDEKLISVISLYSSYSHNIHDILSNGEFDEVTVKNLSEANHVLMTGSRIFEVLNDIYSEDLKW